MALFVEARGGEIELREEALPSLEEGQVRGRTLATGISHGTELHTLEEQDAGGPPRKLGYSAVGEVSEVGSAVELVRPGDVVFAYAPHGSAFQVAESACYALPPGLSPERGQFLALLCVAYNGIMEARMTLGETVVVFGLGVVGQLACQLAQRSGARRVIGVDPLERRREVARATGADEVIDPGAGDLAEVFKALNDGEEADVAIETSGAIGGLNGAFRVLRDQCEVIALSWYPDSAEGLNLNRDFHFKRLKIRVAQSRSVHPELSPRWTHQRRVHTAAEMMPDLQLEELITHRVGIERADEAYRLLREHPGQAIQIVFTYSQDAL